MSDTRGDLPFWQAVAGLAGTFLAALFVGIGRRAGALARRSPEAAASGDALQRQILDQTREGAEATRELAAEIKGMRSDWRDLRDHLEDSFSDLRHSHSIGRRGQNDVKVMLREMLDRFPERVPALPAPAREPEGE